MRAGQPMDFHFQADAAREVELNHRDQACEVLTGTGISRRINGRASGYRALYFGLEDRRVSLNTYARKLESIAPAS